MLQDGITHSTDTALRDFSSVCLHEFVVWSIKQDSRVNIKAISKQIYSFCLHPCPSKRLGECYFVLKFLFHWKRRLKAFMKMVVYLFL
jgi:hypothetical protein